MHCASPSCAPIQSATEAWSRRLASLRAHATDSGDPECPADQRLGVLGRSGQDGTEARTRRLDHAGPRPPLVATRIRKPERAGWAPSGPCQRSRPPGYGRSTASAGAPRALVTGRGYPDTDAQPRRLELCGPRPQVAATRTTTPGGPVTKDHGPASSYITARDLGSLASLYSTNNGEPSGRKLI